MAGITDTIGKIRSLFGRETVLTDPRGRTKRCVPGHGDIPTHVASGFKRPLQLGSRLTSAAILTVLECETHPMAVTDEIKKQRHQITDIGIKS